MDEITICKLGPEDATLLRNVPDGLFDLPLRNDQIAAFLASKEHMMLAAFVGPLMVGMASGLLNLHPDKKPALFLNEVGVRDDWQRRGIATRLVTALIDDAKSRGISAVWVATELDNAPARALYKSLDGAETKDIVVYDWGGAMDV